MLVDAKGIELTWCFSFLFLSVNSSEIKRFAKKPNVRHLQKAHLFLSKGSITENIISMFLSLDSILDIFFQKRTFIIIPNIRRMHINSSYHEL